MERVLRCGTLLCRHRVTGSQPHSVVLLVSLKQTHYAIYLGKKTEREKKKVDCNSDPCFHSEAPPDPSCGVNWDSTWMRLPAFTACWVQFTCLIRFTLCTQVWSINIQAHLTMQASFFLFPISRIGPDASNSEEAILISAIFLFSPQAPLISVVRFPNHISRVFHWFSFYSLIWRV